MAAVNLFPPEPQLFDFRTPDYQLLTIIPKSFIDFSFMLHAGEFSGNHVTSRSNNLQH